MEVSALTPKIPPHTHRIGGLVGLEAAWTLQRLVNSQALDENRTPITWPSSQQYVHHLCLVPTQAILESTPPVFRTYLLTQAGLVFEFLCWLASSVCRCTHSILQSETCWKISCALLSSKVLRKYTDMFCVFGVTEGITSVSGGAVINNKSLSIFLQLIICYACDSVFIYPQSILNRVSMVFVALVAVKVLYSDI